MGHLKLHLSLIHAVKRGGTNLLLEDDGLCAWLQFGKTLSKHLFPENSLATSRIQVGDDLVVARSHAWWRGPPKLPSNGPRAARITPEPGASVAWHAAPAAAKDPKGGAGAWREAPEPPASARCCEPFVAGRWRALLLPGSNKKLLSPVVRTTGQTRSQPLANEYPQLLLQLPAQNETICLNTDGQAQSSVDLLSDPEQGISVTGNLGDKMNHFVQFRITYVNPSVQIHVSTDAVVVRHNDETTRLPWTESATSAVQGLRLSVEKERSLTMSLPDTVTVKISFIKLPDDFLGLYFLDTNHFSDNVSGVLGQLYSKAQLENKPSVDQRDDERLLSVSGSEHRVTRQYKKDYRLEAASDPVSCWSLHLTS